MLSIKARADGRQLIFPVVWALWEPLVLLFSLVQRCNSSGLLLPVLGICDQPAGMHWPTLQSSRDEMLIDNWSTKHADAGPSENG
jgi:hypothetical protein